jgi:hypothetical protein
MAIRQPNAPRRQRIDVRRLGDLAAIDTHIANAQIVGHDQDDIGGATRLGVGGSGSQRKTAGQGQPEPEKLARPRR